MSASHIFRLLIVSTSAVSLGLTGYLAERSDGGSVEQQWPVANASLAASSADADVEALVTLGPRVAGTAGSREAIAYLRNEYRRAGYVTKVQTFTYPKFEDRGSSLAVSGTAIEGRALNDSPAGELTTSLVAVPNVGRESDFAAVDVAGKIAIVRRGEIRFLEKANNAAAAGAVGLVIVNHSPENFRGTLGEETSIPVLAVSGEQGSPLLNAQGGEATLVVDTVERLVTGRNLIAHREGVTEPEVLLGAHYDSVVDSPGANDNASGTAVLLDIARNLPAESAQKTWFVAFDGEEDGLQGSRAFVEATSPQFLSQLQGMLNFDMVGVNEELQVGGTAALTTLVQQGSSEAGGGSDHVPFAEAGVPVLFFTRGLDPNYHQPTDLQVVPRLLDETTEAGLGVVEKLLSEGALLDRR
ncbi:MAG: M28 family peptidase [Cyanophyceae cyanobacterium]